MLTMNKCNTLLYKFLIFRTVIGVINFLNCKKNAFGNHLIKNIKRFLKKFILNTKYKIKNTNILRFKYFHFKCIYVFKCIYFK